jgi:hypothetical protein
MSTFTEKYRYTYPTAFMLHQQNYLFISFEFRSVCNGIVILECLSWVRMCNTVSTKKKSIEVEFRGVNFNIPQRILKRNFINTH